MIPRLLWRIKGFTVMEAKNPLLKGKRVSELPSGTKLEKKRILIFSPFLDGMYCKFNGRFTRKQNGSAF